MIAVKSLEEIKILKEGGRRLAFVMSCLVQKVVPGENGEGLEEMARALIKKVGARPSFLGYVPKGNAKPYPAALCVSLNNEVVHGLPLKKKVFKEGDVVSLDLGLEYKGLYTDMAATVGVKQLDGKSQKLIEVTRKALEKGVSVLREGARLGDYGFAVQSFVERNGFSVVKTLVGHGVGYKPHEEPEIPNWGGRGQGALLKNGMVLALEPMVCELSSAVELADDGWTWKTKDGSLAAHFECSVAVEKNGCQILTPFKSN
jgi:methionyl aminopeptidase